MSRLAYRKKDHVADEWEDKGTTTGSGLLSSLVTGLFDVGDVHKVENTRTGETREVDRQPGQSVGDAIAEGRFVDKK